MILSSYNPLDAPLTDTFESAAIRPRSGPGGRFGPGQRKNPVGSPIVTVFGAGIAGLSAAHELIERGFSVQVVEPARSPDEEYAVEVGGLARNQFGRVPEKPAALHEPAKKTPDEEFRRCIQQVLRMRSRGMQRVQRRFPVPWRIAFDANEGTAFDADRADDWGVLNSVKLQAVWETLKAAYREYGAVVDAQVAQAEGDDTGPKPPKDWIAREKLYVEIRGHTSNEFNEQENRRISGERAKAVLDALRPLNTKDAALPNFDDHFRPVGVGSAEPLGDQRDLEARRRSNRVEFRIVEQLIPGEHGYRFFPAFYRHLFDLMKRTPVLDAEGHATGQTAFDRLTPTSDLGLAVGDGRRPATIQTRRAQSIEELRRLSELFLGRLGVTHRDVARFHIRLLKFLTSSPQRREREYEQQTWWEFLGGDDGRGYSSRMQHYLKETSQALIAMNAEEVDARSHGNIVAQLQLQYLQDRSDYTLNGPTSDVWLRPWKQYLKRQGVRFFAGSLVKLEWREDDDFGLELVPVTGDRVGWLAPPARVSGGPGDLVKQQSQNVADEALPAQPGRAVVVIDVRGADDGDYVVRVSGRTYCVTARKNTRDEIAAALASQLAADRHVFVRATGSRVILRQPLELEIPRTRTFTFDDADEPGMGEHRRHVTTAALDEEITPSARARLMEALAEYLESRRGAAARTDSPGRSLNDHQWTLLARLRATDAQIDGDIHKVEQELGRELVPHMEVESKVVRLKPPAWVRQHLSSHDECGSVRTLCPYHFRVGPPAAGVVWVDVENADGNLTVLSEPLPEEPRHNYLSHCERPRAFQPDFYVLALPLPECSRLVARAEEDRPGTLHGCLAEILEFDRRSGRRRPDGELVRVSRDVHGRPPRDYPLRDFAGIQYYFDNQVRIGKGHVYFPHAEWGLSSISQLAYWRERMSPAGPFMGQLSVDIGNFYRPARARNGTRYPRSAWNSSAPEIAEEVWFQVRQAHERERAGVLAAPSYYHIDEGLSFADVRSSTFRQSVTILVSATDRSATYALWINGARFEYRVEAPGVRGKIIADELARQINNAAFGTLSARALPHEGSSAHELHVEARVLHDGALVHVTSAAPVRYELLVGDRSYVFAPATPAASVRTGTPSRGEIRDALLGAVLADPHPLVTARPSRDTGLLLLPHAAHDLPSIAVRSDGDRLELVFGPRLHVRLEQCCGGLAFLDPHAATVGGNRTPFLINVPGQWRYRPGLFTPDELTFEDSVLRPRRAERVRYRISNRRWVCAGTHMATTTQLTTMEAATESARHAVNAILRCLANRPGDEYNAQGRVFAELAEIWDPELYEIDDLEPLKRLDRKLVEEGLPHVMDILKIVEAVDAMPMHGKPSDDPLANMLHLLQHIVDGSDRDWAFLRQTLNDFVGQAVERAGDVLDPLGIRRELRNGPGQILERLRDMLRKVTNTGGGNPPDTGTAAS